MFLPGLYVRPSGSKISQHEYRVLRVQYFVTMVLSREKSPHHASNPQTVPQMMEYAGYVKVLSAASLREYANNWQQSTDHSLISIHRENCSSSTEQRRIQPAYTGDASVAHWFSNSVSVLTIGTSSKSRCKHASEDVGRESQDARFAGSRSHAVRSLECPTMFGS